VISDSKEAVGALVDASRKAPDASVNALISIGKEAASQGDPRMTGSVLDGLEKIQTISPEMANKAAFARQDIVKSLSAQSRVE
jgi:hypothetical protein